MRFGINQVSWVISIIVHILVIGLSFKMVHVKKVEKSPEYIAIKAQLYSPPKPKVSAKKLVSKKGKKLPVKKAAPTSLPGDRKQPETTKRIQPTYPKSALNNEWEGTVKVKVTVDSSGKPINVEIISSSGHSSLDKAFIRAIKNGYQFKPKRIMGKNVVGTTVLSHSFKLEGQ